MRIVRILPVLLGIFTATAIAGVIAPLGKLLEKSYPFIRNDERVVVLVSFRDKPEGNGYRIQDARPLISERSINRRLRVRAADKVIDAQDLPLNGTYVDAVKQHITSFRHELKWFNAVSVEATKNQIEELRALPFVSGVELVARWKVDQSSETFQPAAIKPAPVRETNGTTSLDYGPSGTQLNQIHVPTVHDLGIQGQGVVVGVFDNGVRLLSHEAFASMHIIAQHDFVDHKESVIPNNTNTGFGSHGVNTLSTIGGYKPGQLIGPAFRSDYILGRTENDSSETPIEEDNWAAAIQWADSIGVDVTSTSLGYLTFDAPYTSLTWADMDGHTPLITNAADRAVGLGIVVVNAAGNEGPGDGVHNTLIAPADGDSVITAGAVTSSGVRSSFSSVGPTTDVPARIKPDIMAMGSGVVVASSTNPSGYGTSSGTSFATPLSAGVAALIRCANPSLTPMEVRDAMRLTASNAASPNNQMGWGILNADSAIRYFGTLPMGHIHGVVFNDLNGNGLQDAGEAAIQGITIRLSGAVAESLQTAADGSYSFGSLPIGGITVTAALPAGWTTIASTNPFNFTLLHRADTTISFAAFRLGSISGTVYHDINYNQTRDAGEDGIPGIPVHLSGLIPQTVSTDSLGGFSFGSLLGGTYTVSESLSGDWLQTVPPVNGSYSITVTSGLDTAGLVFGAYESTVQPVQVHAGWNLMSLPGTLADYRTAHVFPSASSGAFIYSNRYENIDTLTNGTGFWIKFPTSQTLAIGDLPVSRDTMAVKKGWNMIGSVSSPVATGAVQSIPPGIVTSPYFAFGSAYTSTDSIRPYTGYWVKTSSAGQLVISAGSVAKNSSLGNEQPSSVGTITFTDAAGAAQTLHVGAASTGPDLELPPLPPPGGFDARFGNGRLVIPPTAGEYPVEIQTSRYPVHISWQGIALPASLIASGRTITMSISGSATVADGSAKISVKLLTPAPAGEPTAFGLARNWPNPFNPSTSIGYTIKQQGIVTMKIFDILGREVAILLNEPHAPGSYSITWNAAGFPAGVYFCRLQEGATVSTLAISLVK